MNFQLITCESAGLSGLGDEVGSTLRRSVGQLQARAIGQGEDAGGRTGLGVGVSATVEVAAIFCVGIAATAAAGEDNLPGGGRGDVDAAIECFPVQRGRGPIAAGV